MSCPVCNFRPCVCVLDGDPDDALDYAEPCVECPTCGAFTPVGSACETCEGELGGEA